MMPKCVKPLLDYERAVKKFESKGFDIENGKEYSIVYHEKHTKAILTLPKLGNFTGALWRKIRKVLSLIPIEGKE